MSYYGAWLVEECSSIHKAPNGALFGSMQRPYSSIAARDSEALEGLSVLETQLKGLPKKDNPCPYVLLGHMVIIIERADSSHP